MSPNPLIARARKLLAGMLVASTLAVVSVACTAAGGTPDAVGPVQPAGAESSSPPPTNAASDQQAPARRPEAIDDGTPGAAVVSFAAAEAAEAHDLSLMLLAAADREAAGSLDAWVDRHATLWPLIGAEVLDVADDSSGTSATVTTRLTYHSQLDETVGLVPAHARGRWKVVHEDDRWRISLFDLEVTPDLPDDRGAVDGARAWSAERQRCTTPAEQYTGGLVAFPSVADALCGTEGDLIVGPAPRLTEGPDSDAFIAAFGPQVLNWARVVAVQAPVPFRAVLAPVGDRWIVTGLLPAS